MKTDIDQEILKVALQYLKGDAAPTESSILVAYSCPNWKDDPEEYQLIVYISYKSGEAPKESIQLRCGYCDTFLELAE